jgi:hypothetical protein
VQQRGVCITRKKSGSSTNIFPFGISNARAFDHHVKTKPNQSDREVARLIERVTYSPRQVGRSIMVSIRERPAATEDRAVPGTEET